MKLDSSNTELKKKAGVRAADYVSHGMMIGIGTGSTVAFFVEELERRIKQGLEIRAVATSYQSRILCKQHGIPLIDTMFASRLDLAVDGADEIDPSLNAIKGGGAAQTVEKIVASMSDRFIIIADESKLVNRLCANFPLPVEVIPDGLSLAKDRISALGGKALLRMALRKDGPVITENGNFILDISFESAPADIGGLHIRLKSIPGLVETGLFLGLASIAIIGSKDEMKILKAVE
ncbi:MAG TPA: ribose-5-phosphate isomerase RpiA [Bacillota bacterium]|nr:ribose-5-phosphate isomerase RpiA [Bacillota bacterium]